MSHLITPSEFDALSRVDFEVFAERVFASLSPSIKFLSGDHISLICDALMRVYAGETKRLIINVPPRSFKSLLGSIAFPAFVLGHRPSTRIICASYSESLAEKFGRDTRRIFQEAWYQRLFPKMRISAAKSQADELETTAGGSRLAVSAEGGITGYGADVIIVDDPQKPDEALSANARQRTITWFSEVLLPRQNDKNTAAIIVIMQRLHQEDLTGYLLAQGGWERLSFPAIAECDEVFECRSPLGKFIVRRKAGEALHPAREDLEVLAKTRREIGPVAFSGQFQQNPAPREGALVKREWFSRYSEKPKCERIIQSWDCATKTTELHDYSVCTTWGIMAGGDFALLHVYRERLEYPELKRKVRELAGAHGARTVLIEDCSAGTQLLQELKLEGFALLKACKPDRDKEMRLVVRTPVMEAGKVFLPIQAPWLDAYLDELLMFPNSKHDDQVDSTTQFLAHMSMPTAAQGWFEYYRKKAEELRDQEQFGGLPPLS